AGSQPRRPKSRLAEHVTLPAFAENRVLRHHAVLKSNFTVITLTRHRVDIADDSESRIRQIDHECRVASLRWLGFGIGLRNDDCEFGAVCARDKPFMAVNYPIVAIQFGVRLYLRRI